MSMSEFFAFLRSPDTGYSHVHVDTGKRAPFPIDHLPRRRSVRSWRGHVDLAVIEDVLASDRQLPSTSSPAVRVVLIAPGLDRATFSRYTQLYGPAPAYVSFSVESSAFAHLSEREYVDLHIDIGRYAQRLWLAFIGRGPGCLPLGRVEGGRIHDLPGSGMRPLFTMAVGVAHDTEVVAK